MDNLYDYGLPCMITNFLIIINLQIKFVPIYKYIMSSNFEISIGIM
jgi:hypothetical protein